MAQKIQKTKYWVPRRAGFCTDGTSIFRGGTYLNKDLAVKFDCGYGYHELNIACTAMRSDNDATIDSCEYRGYRIANACDEITRDDKYPIKYKVFDNTGNITAEHVGYSEHDVFYGILDHIDQTLFDREFMEEGE